MSKKLSIRFVADTPDKRERGLMYANPLAENESVLFVFPRAERYAFWNHNVSFDLSLAFLDENGRVVDIKDMDAHSTKSVAPEREARYVVEACKGAFAKHGVEKGDMIVYADHNLVMSKTA